MPKPPTTAEKWLVELEDALDGAILDYAREYPEDPVYYPAGAVTVKDVPEPLRSIVLRERRQGIIYGLALSIGMTPEETHERVLSARAFHEHTAQTGEQLEVPEGAW